MRALKSSTQAMPVTDITAIPGLRELWAETLGDPHICIAVLDGPVDQSHPSLIDANLTELRTLVAKGALGGTASRHGTHVVSVIFGQHDGPIKGIAPRCRGLIVPVFSDCSDNNSFAPCSQLDLARAINQAVQEGAHIINISGGEFAPAGTAHPLLARAVQNCVAQDVLIVAAAGNEGCDCLHIPGALPSVLAVGAMDSRGSPLVCSNWGENYRTQGILAPGENIPGAGPDGALCVNSGTSYATPIVSGITALLLSLQLKHGQKPDLQAIRSAILDSALDCRDQAIPDCRRLLAGRLNVKGAISRIVPGIVGTRAAVPADSHLEFPEISSRPPGTGAPKSERDSEPMNHNMADSNGPKCASCQCSCESGARTQLIFALGKLSYDFGIEARRDSIRQHMDPNANDPYDPEQLLAYLEKNPWDASAIHWTLNLDATPIYAIQAQGAFASDVYQRLREFLGEQIKGEVERVSIPGHLVGKVKLFTGQIVPSILPDLRGMYSWNTKSLVEAICKEKDTNDQYKESVANLLLRIYEDLRNLGITSQERAINYAATNALLAADVVEDAITKGMELDTIGVERSPVCRPEADCWDVKLTFFNPSKVFEQARKVYLLTVDVSDTVPVMVGRVRSWFLR